MLEPDPARRLKSMAEVRDFPAGAPGRFPRCRCHGHCDGGGQQAVRETACAQCETGRTCSCRSRGRKRSSPFRLGLFASALAVAVLLGVGGGWLYVRSQSPAEQAAVAQGETAQSTQPAEQTEQSAPPPPETATATPPAEQAEQAAPSPETAQPPQSTTAADTTAVQPPSPEPADVTLPPEPVQPPNTEVAVLPTKAAKIAARIAQNLMHLAFLRCGGSCSPMMPAGVSMPTFRRRARSRPFRSMLDRRQRWTSSGQC